LICHELLEQRDVLVIKSVYGEVYFGLGPWNAFFRTGILPSASAPSRRPVRIRFARHNRLFDFPMDRVPAQSRVVFSQFKLLRF